MRLLRAADALHCPGVGCEPGCYLCPFSLMRVTRRSVRRPGSEGERRKAKRPEKWLGPRIERGVEERTQANAPAPHMLPENVRDEVHQGHRFHARAASGQERGRGLGRR